MGRQARIRELRRVMAQAEPGTPVLLTAAQAWLATQLGYGPAPAPELAVTHVDEARPVIDMPIRDNIDDAARDMMIFGSSLVRLPFAAAPEDLAPAKARFPKAP